jgi:hypothetical protein
LTRTWKSRFLFLAIIVLGGMATSAYASPAQSALRQGLKTAAPVVSTTAERNVSMGETYRAASFVNNKIEGNASREASPKPTSRRKANARPEPAPYYNEEMGTCLRGGDCTCTSKNHAVTHCYYNAEIAITTRVFSAYGDLRRVRERESEYKLLAPCELSCVSGCDLARTCFMQPFLILKKKSKASKVW